MATHQPRRKGKKFHLVPAALALPSIDAHRSKIIANSFIKAMLVALVFSITLAASATLMLLTRELLRHRCYNLGNLIKSSLGIPRHQLDNFSNGTLFITSVDPPRTITNPKVLLPFRPEYFSRIGIQTSSVARVNSRSNTTVAPHLRCVPTFHNT